MKRILLLLALLAGAAACAGGGSGSRFFSPGATAALRAKPGQNEIVHPMTCPTATPIFIEAANTGTHIRTFNCGTKINDIYGSNTGINVITSLGTDPTTGNVYAVQAYPYVGNILVFSPTATGNATPSANISYNTDSGGGTSPVQIANDSNGNIWAGSGFDGEDYNERYLFRINQGDNGLITPEQIVKADVTPRIWDWESLSVGSSDNVWGIATNTSGVASILKFLSSDTGRVAPSKYFRGSNVTGGSLPPVMSYNGSMIVAGNNKIYVATTYGTGASQTHVPVIWVWNANDANGNTAPDHSIQGSNTALVSPQQMQVDSTGNLWVSDGGASAVLVFDGATYGNASPTAT